MSIETYEIRESTKVAKLKINIDDGNGNEYVKCEIFGYGETDELARIDLQESIDEFFNEFNQYL